MIATNKGKNIKKLSLVTKTDPEPDRPEFLTKNAVKRNPMEARIKGDKKKGVLTFGL